MTDPPKGLGEAGCALWRLVIADVPEGFALEERDWHVLESACKVQTTSWLSRRSSHAKATPSSEHAARLSSTRRFRSVGWPAQSRFGS